jgi:hypothetical protein
MTRPVPFDIQRADEPPEQVHAFRVPGLRAGPVQDGGQRIGPARLARDFLGLGSLARPGLPLLVISGGQAGLIAAAEIYHARARCASPVIGDSNQGRLRR